MATVLSPRHGKRVTILVACLVGTVPGVAFAAPRANVRAPEQRALLTVHDLGSGWSVDSPPPRPTPPLTCRAFAPRLAGVRQLGAAASPTYARRGADIWLSQVAYRYGSASQAGVVWRRVVTPRLLACVVASLRGGGASFGVTSRRVLGLRGVATRVERLRVSGTARAYGQTLPFTVDEVVLARGAIVSVLDFATFDAPAPDALERRVVALAARHA
jgi:hypothetical protein